MNTTDSQTGLTRKIIWSDDYSRICELQGSLREEYPDCTDGELYRLAAEINGEYLEDTRNHLNIQLTQEILVIAELQLWNGSPTGYREISSGNIRDCFYADTELTEWYIDPYGDLRAEAAHHDGTNRYLYRVYRDSATDQQRENLKEKIVSGRVTRSDITRITRRLGDSIGAVYGWKFPDYVRKRSEGTVR